MNNSAASSAHTTTTTTTTATQQKPKPIRLKTPSSSLLLLGIILASVALRLAAALYLGNSVDSLPGIDDQRSYHMLAQRLLQGHGFTVAENWWPMTMAGEPTAHWSYLYVLFLYAVYSLVGVTPWVARLIQVLIVGVAWPLLAYRITGRILSESDRSVQSLPTAIATWAPLIAAGWSAFYPYFIYYSAGLLTESFYIICVLWVINLSLGIASTLKTQFPPTRLTRYWLLLGLAVAAAVLLRQLFLIVVPCVFVWMAWATRPQSSSAVRVMPMLTQWRAHWSAPASRGGVRRAHPGCVHRALHRLELPEFSQVRPAQYQCGLCLLLGQPPYLWHTVHRDIAQRHLRANHPRRVTHAR
ncbi:MAG: hypothetical protein HC853_14015 [Anaerolineae bacterium]|nr:hypothetical protein [Anaerolineae bacterium]